MIEVYRVARDMLRVEYSMSYYYFKIGVMTFSSS